MAATTKVAAALSILLWLGASQAAARDSSQVRAFKRHNPCPATGARRGSCPGWIVDHVQPICAGGPDKPSNMQWQTIADAKVKDRQERRMCRGMREGAVKQIGADAE